MGIRCNQSDGAGSFCAFLLGDFAGESYGDITFSFWVLRYTTGIASGAYARPWDCSYLSGYAFYRNNTGDDLGFLWVNSGGVTSGNLTADAWDNIIVTRKSSDGAVNIYRNGTLANSATGATGSVALGAMGFGNNATGFTEPWRGGLAEAGVWDSTLGSSDRTLLQTTYPSGVAASSLKHYWPMLTSQATENDQKGSMHLTTTVVVNGQIDTTATHPSLSSPSSGNRRRRLLLSRAG